MFWYAAAVLACLLGMATKEVMVTAPLVVLLFDRTFLAGSFVRGIAAALGAVPRPGGHLGAAGLPGGVDRAAGPQRPNWDVRTPGPTPARSRA